MFNNYYYYFIAGLPDILLDESEIQFPMLDFKHELKENLHPKDYNLIELLFLPYDNKNLLFFLNEKFDKFNDLGKFSAQDFEIEFTDENKGILPSYMYSFFEKYKNEEEKKPISHWEKILTEMYYQFVLKTKNKFLQQWFQFNQNLNNILIGINCRKHNIENIENQLIGNNFVTEAITKSNAKDFGLEVELPYVSEIISIAENNNLFTREKNLDKLKWDKLEEITLFNYFSIEVILAYTIKLDMAYRWLELDEETGSQMFRKIINDLKSGFEFPKEFEINGKNK